MYIETALKTHLLSKTALTALVGQNIFYLGEVPQGVTEPYVVFFKVSTTREHSFSGSSQLARARFQFSVFSDSYYEAKQIVEQLQVALQGVTGNIGDSPYVNVGAILYENEQDLYETETKLYHIAVDYMITNTDNH